ncbi:polysaccharide pyruvyl transferase family protein [Falsiroseomonas oryzae]|uniref:polysaccharide pyruvyl transferase family protein n=1 Tax=Falsiroseomonas oryzae TaxID=2766473 RepID=UPI0022EA4CA5|nr:polysaccharide pyruvyl transferase family protein [Roseomonas sp. MO-31]
MKVAYLAENFGRVDRAWAKGGDGLMHHTGHNVGNMAFWYAARMLIDAECHLVGRSTRAKDVPDDVRAFVIPAANFLNKGADLTQLADLVRDLDRPCLVLGLGAQAETADQPPALKPGTLAFLQEVAKRTPSLGIRGTFTQKLCGTLGVENTTVLGCPSILINPARDLGQRLQRKIDAMAEDGPFAVHAACIKSVVMGVERELVRLAQLHPGSAYVVQRPVELIKAVYGETMSDAETEGFRKCAQFLGFGTRTDKLLAFLRSTLLVPDSIDGWVHGLRRFTAGVNTRIHGTLMCTAAEIPGVCIWHDTRTYELTQEMRLPNLSVRAFTENRYSVRDLFTASNFDAEAFDARRMELARMNAEIIRQAGLTPSRHLRSFLDS